MRAGLSPLAVLAGAIATSALVMASCEGDILIGADAPLTAADASPSFDVAVSDVAAPDGDGGAGSSDAAPDAIADDSGLIPLTAPWSTSFEDGFADWTADGEGFCYEVAGATFTLVTSPVHSGSYAAGFTVQTPSDAGESQTRCVRQGVLPQSAVYGAWYYLPASATTTGNWNLFHFQGGTVPDGTFAHNLWDVSFENGSSGSLKVYGLDFFTDASPDATATPTVPIATWFHLEFLLRRDADAGGEVALMQDGKTIFDVSGIVTDDSLWGQWHVGNLAAALVPANVTLYVDDVTITPTR